MPTYKRYIFKDRKTVYLFSKKPSAIYSRSWKDAGGNRHPLCCLQEYEADFDFDALPPNRVVEVTINVKLKNK